MPNPNRVPAFLKNYLTFQKKEKNMSKIEKFEDIKSGGLLES